MSTNTHFVLRKNTNPQSKHSSVQGICRELYGTVVVLVAMSFNSIVVEFPFNTENWKICSIFFTWSAGKLGWSRVLLNWRRCKSQSRWKNVDLLELPVATQDYTWLCRAPGEIVRELEIVTFEVASFVLRNILPASMFLYLLKRFTKLSPRFSFDYLSVKTRLLLKTPKLIQANFPTTATIKKTWFYLSQSSSRYLSVFFSQIFYFCWLSTAAFGEFRHFWWTNCLGGKFV